MGRSINHPEVNFVSLSRIIGCVEVISMHRCRNCIVIPAGLAVLLLLALCPHSPNLSTTANVIPETPDG